MSTLKVDTIRNEADGAAVDINRTTSDGTILDLQKDGTTVGSIAAINGDVGIGTGVCGVKFLDSQPALTPADASNTFANADNSINLGWSSVRWKDLYLSGGVYLGGTGAANYLDDYEEGTWTPTLIGSTGGEASYNTRGGSYTKIGRYVVCNININLISKGTLTGVLYVSNLPFTVGDTLALTSIESVGNAYFNNLTNAASYMNLFATQLSTNLELFVVSGTSSTAMSALHTNDISTSFSLRATIGYFTS